MALQDRRVLEPAPEAAQGPIYRMHRPYFCYGLIGVCAAVYLASPPDPSFSRSALVPHLPELFLLYGPAVTAGEWWRVFTAVLVHGNVLHIFLNMWVVASLGFGLERVIGTGRMAVVSLAGALGSAALTLLLSYRQPTLGASGMILSWAGVMLPIMNQQGRRSIGIWLVQVALLSLIPHISWQGHLGGFLFGLPCGFALRLGRTRFWYAMPFILFGAGVLTVVAAHPEKVRALTAQAEAVHP